ncbi:MAG: toll/interleukin-1 receptor domain-containing protein [Clostridiales bacterium]|nr:toll/interleukin-1 receptor domain-containing protein [Clostridiales bacterium]
MGSIFDDAISDLECPWGLVLLATKDSPYIYVSYQTEQLSQARKVVQVLFEMGYPIWFDWEEGLTPWNSEMSDSLECCALVVALKALGQRQRPINRCEEEFSKLLGKKRLVLWVDGDPEEPNTQELEDMINCDPEDPRFPEMLKQKLLKMGFTPDMKRGAAPDAPKYDLMLRYYPDVNDRIREAAIDCTYMCNLRTHAGYDPRLKRKFTVPEKEIQIAQELKVYHYYVEPKSPLPDYEMTPKDDKFRMKLLRGYAVSDKEMKEFYDKRKKHRESLSDRDE